MAIKKDNKVEKLNTLNEMKSTSMTLQEVRFLTIYMSKINARKPDTRKVTFSLDDFRKIMEIKRLTISNIKENTTKLLQKIATIPNDNGGFNQFQLFKKIELNKNELDEWYVTIDCHDEALPLFFEFKKNYFTYELWNALRLSSPNQIRMYEILKQREKFGKWYCPLQKLRDLLFINNKEYPRFQNFKVRVIESCQKALLETTDIKFEYELKKEGPKVIGITFFIEKNDDYIDQLTLQEFIDMDDKMIFTSVQPIENENISFLSEACDNEFTEEQMQILLDLIVKIIPYGSSERLDLDRYDYLSKKYHELQERIKRKDLPTIKSNIAYLKKIIQADIM